MVESDPELGLILHVVLWLQKKRINKPYIVDPRTCDHKDDTTDSIKAFVAFGEIGFGSQQVVVDDLASENHNGPNMEEPEEVFGPEHG